jgi:hypothetical protein
VPPRILFNTRLLDWISTIGPISNSGFFAKFLKMFFFIGLDVTEKSFADFRTLSILSLIVSRVCPSSIFLGFRFIAVVQPAPYAGTVAVSAVFL